MILKRLDSLESENQEIKRGQSSITLAIGEVTNKLGTYDEKIGTLDGQVSSVGKILLPPFHKKLSLVRIWPYLKFPIYCWLLQEKPVNKRHIFKNGQVTSKSMVHKKM